MPRFKAKPMIVEAFRLGGDMTPKWAEDIMEDIVSRACDNDYVFRGEDGEIYVLSPREFERRFDTHSECSPSFYLGGCV